MQQRTGSHELYQNDQLYRAIAVNIPKGAVFVVDRQLRYLLAEGMALRQAGMTPDDFEGKTLWDVVSAELAEQYAVRYRQALGGSPFSVEHNSHGRHYVTHGEPLRDADGRVYAAMAISYDITDRKQTEEALQNSHTVFRTLADNIAQLAWMADPTGWIYWYNKRWFDYTGTTMAQVEGWGWKSLHHPDHLDRVIKTFQEAWTSGISWEDTFPLRGRDGQYRWFLSRALPIRNTEGRILHWFGTNTDITEQRHIAQALRDSEEQRQQALEAADLGTWQYDFRSGFLSMDQRGHRICGTPIDRDLTLDQAFGRIHPDDRQRVRERMLAAIEQTGESNYSSEHRVVLDDGSERWIAATGALFYSHNPRTEPTFLIGTVQDITAHKQLERQLRDRAEALVEADRRKDEFLATLAHELRNPLAPIRNSIDLLRMHEISDPTLLKTHAVIDRQVSKMARLLDDLLDVSRITRNRMTLRREPVELSTVIDSAIETSRPLIEAADHRLQIELPAEPVTLNADPTRLAQVFSNLLNNAAKYTDPGGLIRLSVTCDDTSVTGRVQDNGIGIDRNQLPRLFDMFSQVESALDRAQGGLGIGLALVRGLVELHGGQVEVDSAGVGQGSEFSVYLPIRHRDPSPANDTTADPGHSHRHRILVVDDLIDSADSLAMVLRHFGHDVRTAYSGEQAISTAEQYRPDLILLDIGMPNINGYQVADWLRQRPWGNTVMLIAQTGWGQKEDYQRTRQVGFDHHLIKPLQIARLLKLIDRLPATVQDDNR